VCVFSTSESDLGSSRATVQTPVHPEFDLAPGPDCACEASFAPGGASQLIPDGKPTLHSESDRDAIDHVRINGRMGIRIRQGNTAMGSQDAHETATRPLAARSATPPSHCARGQWPRHGTGCDVSGAASPEIEARLADSIKYGDDEVSQTL
jgi:hypothetical protein